MPPRILLTSVLCAEPDEFREGPLEADKKPDEVPQEPVKLHKDFTWVTVDLSDEAQVRDSRASSPWELH